MFPTLVTLLPAYVDGFVAPADVLLISTAPVNSNGNKAASG